MIPDQDDLDLRYEGYNGIDWRDEADTLDPPNLGHEDQPDNQEELRAA